MTKKKFFLQDFTTFSTQNKVFFNVQNIYESNHKDLHVVLDR